MTLSIASSCGLISLNGARRGGVVLHFVVDLQPVALCVRYDDSTVLHTAGRVWLRARPPGMQGVLECCQNSLVRLSEERRIHRQVYLVLIVFIWIEEDPTTTQGSKKGFNVHARVKLDGEDVGAVWEAAHSDPLVLVEAVNEVSPFGHGGAKTLGKSLGALQGQRCCQAR